jgi:hypothetical protein
MTSEEMVINTRQDWESILAGGAVIVWEEKLFKIFRQPDGRMWRAMPAWRRAWPFDIIEKGNAGIRDHPRLITLECWDRHPGPQHPYDNRLF